MREGHTLMRPETMAQADALFGEAEGHLRAAPPGKWLCLTLARRADVAVRGGAPEAGPRLYDEAIGLSHALEFRLGQLTATSNMTEVLFTLGRRREAIARLRALLDRFPPGSRSQAMATLVAHLVLDDRPGEAAVAAAEVALWAPATGMQGPLAWAAEAMALLPAREGRLATAATLSGYALRVLPAVGSRFGSRRAVHDELGRRLEGLAVAERAALRAKGAAWTMPVAARAVEIACRSVTSADGDLAAAD